MGGGGRQSCGRSWREEQGLGERGRGRGMCRGGEDGAGALGVAARAGAE